MSSRGATLRIARRGALRHKGRSALVIAMIGLPVLGVTAIDVTARTYQLDDQQKAERSIGQADAALSDSGSTAITQNNAGYYDVKDGVGYDQARRIDLAAGLPAGSRTLTDRRAAAKVRSGDRTVSVQGRELAYSDPLARGIYVQADGRAPRGPDETALTVTLADRLGVRPGDRVALDDRDVTVVGTVDSRTSYDAEDALVGPGGLSAQKNVSERLLVDLPGTADLAFVQSENARGVQVRPAVPVVGLPDPVGGSGGSDTTVIAALVLVVGMALLEVVLLAGPAFAVGAKRQARQLALLAATGAERKDVRRTVLGEGLILGAVGGVVGLAGGIGLGALAPTLLRRFDGSVPGPLDLRPELLLIVALGVVTALLAAILPARAAARQDVVAALTGRRGTTRGSRVLPVVGLVMAAAGTAIALLGASSSEATVILAGSVVAELGLVATTPFLVGVAGRLGPRLPLAPRLALRDASRNRSRTAPAVAAILAAVAGSVAIGTYVASTSAHDRATYTAQAVPGTAIVLLPQETDEAGVGRAARTLTDLPVQESVPLRGMAYEGNHLEVVPPGTCTVDCDVERSFGGGYVSGPVEDGPGVLAAATGADDPALHRVLDAGGAVVPVDGLSPDGTVTLRTVDQNGNPVGPARTVPGAGLPPDARQVVVLAPQLLVEEGVQTRLEALALRLTRLPTSDESDRAQSALADAGFDQSTTLYVERGYVDNYQIGLLALVGGSALLVLGASSIATGLAAADGVADLATLAAVGATPGLRRVLAAFQSYVTAILGTVLGALAGLVPAVALIRATQTGQGAGLPLTLPWTNLLITIVAVPIVAALAAAAVTRSRLPLVRRAA